MKEDRPWFMESAISLPLSIVLLSALAILLKHTKFGKSMRATADNEMVAEILGMDTRRIRRLTFLLGSFLAGVAGLFIPL